MKAKVVAGGDLFFKDDIKIIETELRAQLKIPLPLPVFSNDELQVMYNGHIFVAREGTDTKDAHIKVYTLTYGLVEEYTPKACEDKYFKDNEKTIDALKQDFMERAVTYGNLDAVKQGLVPQIGSELTEMINKEYASLASSTKSDAPPGKGLVGKLDDTSIFSSHFGAQNILILDSRIYALITIPEYLKKHEKSFQKQFFAELEKKSLEATPEEVHKIMTENANYIHPKALPLIRNKVWHSNRSFKLFLDGIYWIPEFKERADDKMIPEYQRMIERHVKIEAAKGMK